MPDREAMLHSLVRCAACGAPLAFSKGGQRVCCEGDTGSVYRRGFLIHDPALGTSPSPEMLVRDGDARNYLSHPKFPTQIDRFKRFVHDRVSKADTVLDLGCGPGPTTEMLLHKGAKVVAVDFSIQSLVINAHLCGAHSDDALFVQADLNTIRFANGAFDGLMMADFLQHLGDRKTQEAFLENAFRALKPGGWFYLSFFNTNMFHRLKGEKEGIQGNIGYRLMSLSEVRALLPEGIVAKREYVTNIFNNAASDRIAARLPGASLFARMCVIEGRRLA